MKNLTSKEEEIMKFLWQSDGMTTRQVVDSFPDPKPHFNTVATFLRILEQKGWVVRRPIPGTHLFTYHAAMSAEEAGRRTMKTIAMRFFHGSIADMVSSLIKNEELTENEVDELIELVKHKNSL